MHGLEINSLKQVNDNYEYIHYSNSLLEIRSKYKQSQVLSVPILEKILPGNIGKYIYPNDSIIHLKDGTKITKLIFNKILNDENNPNNSVKCHNMIFDVPTENEHVEEELIEYDLEDDNENSDEDNEEDVEEDEGWGEEDDEEDFDDAEPPIEF